MSRKKLIELCVAGLAAVIALVVSIVRNWDSGQPLSVGIALVLLYSIGYVVTTFEIISTISEIRRKFTAGSFARLLLLLGLILVAGWLTLSQLIAESSADSPALSNSFDYFVGAVMALLVFRDIIGRLFSSSTTARTSFAERDRHTGDILRVIREWISDYLDAGLQDSHAQFDQTFLAEPSDMAWIKPWLAPNEKGEIQDDTNGAEWPWPEASSHNINDLYSANPDAAHIVILGEPGAGKSMELFRLAKHLEKIAERSTSSTRIVPVIFKLQNWQVPEEIEDPLETMYSWMVEQLLDNPYNIEKKARKTLEELVRSEHIVPLFDGLDEVRGKQATWHCMDALNALMIDRRYVVVTCRAGVYRQLMLQEYREDSRSRVGEPEEVKGFGRITNLWRTTASTQSKTDKQTPIKVAYKPLDSNYLRVYKLKLPDREQIKTYLAESVKNRQKHDAEDSSVAVQTEMAERLTRLVMENRDYMRSVFWLRLLVQIYAHQSVEVIPSGAEDRAGLLAEAEKTFFADFRKRDTAIVGHGGNSAESQEAPDVHTSEDRTAQQTSRENFTDEEVASTLAWLATKLDRNSFAMEDIEPHWLNKSIAARHLGGWYVFYIFLSRIVCGVGLGLAVGRFMGGWVEDLTVGFLAGLIIAILDFIRFRNILRQGREDANWSPGFRQVVAGITSVGLTVGLFCCTTLAMMAVSAPEDVFIRKPFYSTGLYLGTIYTFWFMFFMGWHGAYQNPLNDIHTKEKLKVEPGQALRQFLIVGSVIGGILGVLAMVIYTTDTSFARWLKDYADTFGGGLLGAFLTGSILGFTIGGPFGLVIGSTVYQPVEKSEQDLYQNGIQRTRANAIRMGWIFAGIFTPICIFVFGAVNQFDLYSMMQGFNNGIGIGLIAVFWHGGFDIIQHYTLRLILYLNGHIPLHFADMLRYARRLDFLTPVGGGYAFRHGNWLDYFKTRAINYEAPERPGRLRLVIGSLAVVPFLMFALGFIDRARPWVIEDEHIAVSETIVSDFCFDAGKEVEVSAHGKIKAGNWVLRIGPEGSESGVIGMRLGDNYDVPGWTDEAHGALMCKVPGGTWEPCFERYRSPLYAFSFYPRKTILTTEAPGCIEFAINDDILIDNLGAYSVFATEVTE